MLTNPYIFGSRSIFTPYSQPFSNSGIYPDLEICFLFKSISLHILLGNVSFHNIIVGSIAGAVTGFDGLNAIGHI